MNIKDLFAPKKNADDMKYASSFRRSAAITIDIWVVIFLRVLVMHLLGALWLEQKIIEFHQQFQETFGTESIKNTPEHINFVIHSEAFICVIIFYLAVILVGAFYHASLNASAWRGTIGKRLMKIIIVTDEDKKLSFWRSTSHYFLSILPFAFVTYLVVYKLSHQVTFFQAFTATELNVFLGIIFALWIQIHFFTSKKTTAYDMICDTVLINGRTEKKFPWSKV